jgi:uridine kinase
MERERKFLVDTSLLPNLSAYDSNRIEQYYISVEGDKEIRIRRIGSEYFITHKRGTGAEREETEWGISAEDFQGLRAAAKLPYVTKTRYIIPYNGNTVELDVYSGGLTGLVAAEVEFQSRSEMDAFMPPDWMATEVTNDEQFKNRNLAGINIKRLGLTGPNIYGMLDGVAAAVEMAKEKAKDSHQGAIVIAVAGGSGSGKTSAVAQKIADAFGKGAVMISADDYYRDKAYMAAQKADGADLNWDSPEMVDTNGLCKDLMALRDGKAISKPVYVHKTASIERHEHVPPKPVIIVEGLFALDERLKQITNLRIFVDSTEHSRFLRRLIRDVNRTDLNSQQIAKYFLGTVEPMHRKHVAPRGADADIVIRNDYVPLVEGKRIGKRELQLKFPLPRDLERKLEKLGAIPVARIIQNDTYYTPKEEGFGAGTEMIRVRHESGMDTLTYKLKLSNASGAQERYRIDADLDPETEFQISELYKPTCTVSKRRQFYLLDGMLFSIDDVDRSDESGATKLGKFIEFRFRDAVAMRVDFPPLREKLDIVGAEMGGSYSTIPPQLS